MLLVVGLGNPGKEYEKTRHNIGFAILDALDAEWKNHNHEGHTESHMIHSHELDRGESKDFHAVEYELDVEDDEYRYHVHAGLLKPMTFMNKSGEVVKPIVKSLSERGFEPKDHLLVIHDEMDLPLGQTKLSFGRGSARHNGVQNIIDQLGTQEFSRLRIGVGRPDDKSSADHVLEKFSKAEQEKLQEVFEETHDKINDWIMQSVRAGATDEHS